MEKSALTSAMLNETVLFANNHESTGKFQLNLRIAK